MGQDIKNTAKVVGFQYANVEDMGGGRFVVRLPFANEIDRQRAVSLLRSAYPKLIIELV